MARYFDDVLLLYTDKFGHTFSSVTLSDAGRAKVLKQMELALAGKRGAISEKEANGDIPDDALI
jgi:hypothetical protein